MHPSVVHPTIYGIDIILLPERQRGTALHEQGKIVEFNGSNSGMSAYRTGDVSYYANVVRTLADMRPGQHILRALNMHTATNRFRFYDTDLYASMDGWCRTEYNESCSAEQSRQARKFKRHGRHTTFLHGFATALDGFAFEGVGHTHQEFKSELDMFYWHAAQQAKIPLHAYRDLHTKENVDLVRILESSLTTKIAPKELIRQLKNDQPLRGSKGEIVEIRTKPCYLPSDKVGVVWGPTSARLDRHLPGRSVNGHFAESVTKSKFLITAYTQLLEREQRALEQYMPSTQIYGYGLNDTYEFNTWIMNQKGNRFVKKPSSLSQGDGVQIFSRHTIDNRYLLPTILDTVNPADYRDLAREMLVGSYNPDVHALVFQEFVPSQRIPHPDTGEPLTACARAMVINGRCHGVIWRASKGAVHNVAKGALVIAPTPKDAALIGEIAEAGVAAFEETNRAVRERVGQMRSPFSQDQTWWESMEEVERVTVAASLNMMQQSARRKGVRLSLQNLETGARRA